MEAETPHLVVPDLHMPGMDGWAVVRRARRHCPQIPVIVLTAYATSETHQDIRQMGGTIYIAKPFANVGRHAEERGIGCAAIRTL